MHLNEITKKKFIFLPQNNTRYVYTFILTSINKYSHIYKQLVHTTNDYDYLLPWQYKPGYSVIYTIQPLSI
jgi:hypothetical protein